MKTPQPVLPWCKGQHSEMLYKTDDRACGDWSKKVYCEDQEACKEKFGNTTSTQCVSKDSNKFCAPLKCFDYDDCPNIPIPDSECWSSKIVGECNIEKHECSYDGFTSSNIC